VGAGVLAGEGSGMALLMTVEELERFLAA